MITPEQAMQMTPEEEALCQKVEAQIDASITEYFGKWGTHYVVVSASGLNRRVREHLMKSYRAAGWKVTYHDDQRDGASLRFETAPSRQVENE